MRLRTGHLARRVPPAALSVGALALTAALTPGVGGVASAQAVMHEGRSAGGAAATPQPAASTADRR